MYHTVSYKKQETISLTLFLLWYNNIAMHIFAFLHQ